MIRVAFPLVGGPDWTGTGIHNYLVNLARLLIEYVPDRVQPVVFAGADSNPVNIDPFVSIPGLQVVRAAAFNDALEGKRLREALLLGTDRRAERCFREQNIDVLFENARYYGWRFSIPALAWMPDFQHRHLKEFFGTARSWKRDLGYRAQMLGKRLIMLSSEDSRQDCERFFPQSIGRTSVVRFAVSPSNLCDYTDARRTADSYKLPENFFYLPNQFWKHKNHVVVIEALYLLKQQGHDVVVAATGKPDDYRHRDHYAQLCSLVETYHLKDNFRLLGRISRQDVFSLMRTCTALINPSLFEGWSSTVEEAKSLGIPMLLSNLNVHMEQAAGLAEFFPPHAPEQLAALLAGHKKLTVAERAEREQAAIAASRGRIKQYAQNFADTAERAASLL